MNHPNPTIPVRLQSEAADAQLDARFSESVHASELPTASPLSASAADTLSDSRTDASFTAPVGIPADVSTDTDTDDSTGDGDSAVRAAVETAAPPVPDTLPAPSEQTLMNELAPLRAQYPRMDIPAVLASDAFRDFGQSVGWDSRELSARLPALIEASRALSLAVEPPVSRVTAAAASHRRPLLSPSQQKELAAWNRDYPAYRMTELEYFNALGK